MLNQKTSLLVNNQVPSYVREEYPVFISFLEAYYEFLETKQGTQNNDLLLQAKNLKDIRDVDLSIDEFEDYFFNTFAALIPKDVAIDKAFLIKNVLPLYLQKGSESSFKLLFRILFGDSLDIKYPGRDNILRASDGKWLIENSLKVSSEISSYYTGNGTANTFYLIQQVEPDSITVYVNDSLVTNYVVRKESQKIIFNSAPAANSTIEVFYPEVDKELFVNRKITGELSGATTIVEKSIRRIINNKQIYEFFVDNKKIVGEYEIGENLLTDIFVDSTLVNIKLTTLSELAGINIISGGTNYNVGDPVIVNSPGAEREARVVVSKTFKSTFDRIEITNGGSGFEINANVTADGFGPPFVDIDITSVFGEGPNTGNVFIIYSDLISDIDPANTLISASDYGLDGVVASPNANTIISQALGNTAYSNIGEISGVLINSVLIQFASQPDFNVEPAKKTLSNVVTYIDSFGSLGSVKIINAGTGYAKGDEIVITNKPMSFGIGAAAEVVSVSASGAIEKVAFVPVKITGTANGSSSNVIVTGTGTAFTTELKVGDDIMLNAEQKKVAVITSDTSLNVNSAFTQTFTDKPVRLFGKYLLGGQGYTKNDLPTLTVVSANGTNANVIVTSIMGDGEQLTAFSGTRKPGEIEEIAIIDPGLGFKSIPSIDLTQSGDGTAEATPVLVPTFEKYAGRWTTSDSILSASDIKLQGLSYYINYAYLVSSTVEFVKYKELLKQLIHPAGFIDYGELNKSNNITTNELVVLSSDVKSISGRVNVSTGSITITGVNTKFIVANTLGIVSNGDYVAVNSEIRIVNNIINNTSITVSSPFTYSANLQEMVIYTGSYNTLASNSFNELQDGQIDLVE